MRRDNAVFIQKSFKNRFDSKIFVYLPLIVRGEIRTVEGNLCLYLRKQNLENFGNGCKIQEAYLICIQSFFKMNTYRLG